MTKLILTILVLSAQTSWATDVWEGAGAYFDINGNQEGEYTLHLENVQQGDKVLSTATVTLSDGSSRKQQCLLSEMSPKGWSALCDNGNGGASCMGEGLCVSYVKNAAGIAYATTIVNDGPSNMRLLRTELRNEKAVRFFREKLVKK